MVNIKKKIIIVILVLVISVAGFAGCSKGPNEFDLVKSFVTTMLTPATYTDSNTAEVVDLYFSGFFSDTNSGKENATQVIEKYHLKLFAENPEINDLETKVISQVTEDGVTEMVISVAYSYKVGEEDAVDHEDKLTFSVVKAGSKYVISKAAVTSSDLVS